MKIMGTLYAIGVFCQEVWRSRLGKGKERRKAPTSGNF